MDSTQLRRAWTDFFSARAHTAVPSAGLIPHHPSAPMFTNSGMMQFVPYFLGEEAVPFDPPRASSIQRCVRAGGKHNDLDAIGRSQRHLSFFEMMGNFSFGDYFKSDAIPWAWEFATGALGLDGDRMWVTCHVSDDDAENIWADAVGFPRERIQRLDKDNFWEMGETGPCGPCSEIFIDFGPELGPEGGPANPEAEHRYIEIWNLVFPQYFRSPDGSLTDLPTRNVDTGMGFERTLAALAGSPSLYDADVLAMLVEEAQSVTGHRLGTGGLGDIAVRLMADHTRTMSFLVADGVLPSNEDRGYVLRRIIRRAVRFAYLLGVERLVLPSMVERCIEIMGEPYPELVASRDLVLGTISREEERFRHTLATGSQLLDTQLDALGGVGTLSGSVAFQLHDTYGFPLEVTQEMAELRGVGIDVAGFDVEMDAQRARARAAGRGTGAPTGDEVAEYQRLVAESGTTEFTGRGEYESAATIVAVLGNGVFLDRTPFYAESGGQVGDTGTIATSTGTVEVTDTGYALPGLVRHEFTVIDGHLEVGQEARAAIDGARRDAIRRNHTATHILHWALRQILGDHVKQQGSLVAPDRLRFDFSHFESVTPEQIRLIEDLANADILTDAPVHHDEMSKEEALAKGAIAFFGEKYGDVVRVLEAGPHSTELCGGTHVHALGEIGPVKIISEGSIGSNVRRLEAVTGTGPIERLRSREATLADAAELLGVPTEDLLGGIEKRLGELTGLRNELKVLRRQLAGSAARSLADSAVDGKLVAVVDVDGRDDLRDLALSLRDQPGVDVVVLGASPGGKGVALVGAVGLESGFNAGELVGAATAITGGGGGKGADFASAGGKDPDRLEEALDAVRGVLGILGR